MPDDIIDNGDGGQPNNPPAGDPNNQHGNQNHQSGNQSGEPGWLAGATAEQKTKYGEWLKKHEKLPVFIDAAATWRSKAENSIQRLTDKSTADELAAYRKAMGVPDKPDGYEIPDEIEGVKLDGKRMAEYREMAHKMHVPSEVVKAFAVMNARQEAAQRAAAEESAALERTKASESCDAQFKKEWAGEFDRNKEITKRGLLSLPPVLQEVILDGGHINKPDLVKWLFAEGRKGMEGNFRQGTGAAGAGKGLTPAELRYPTMREKK